MDIGWEMKRQTRVQRWGNNGASVDGSYHHGWKGLRQPSYSKGRDVRQRKSKSNIHENHDKKVNRRGVSIFINYVSKRIHPSSLKAAFEEYGVVRDVYIAYHSPKRFNMKSTFAFVRFSNIWEVLSAVDLANNRKMDGFTIKVSLDRSFAMATGGSNGGKRSKVHTTSEKLNCYKVKDDRTYMEALMSPLKHKTTKEFLEVEKTGGACHPPKFTTVEKKAPGDSKKEPTSIIVQEAEKRWLKNCLIGQIVAMYDVEIVHQFLKSEGFKVKVSCWHGCYAILTFEEEEQIEFFWDMKELYLRTWFEDIDLVDSFMKLKKLRVWVCIEGLPLEIWNVSVIATICSKWGEVIRLDIDTAEKKCLDVAKVLLGVNCLSAIPPLLSINVEGHCYTLKIATIEYEEERKWIDNDIHYRQWEGSPENFVRIDGKLTCVDSEKVEPQSSGNILEPARGGLRNKTDCLRHLDSNGPNKGESPKYWRKTTLNGLDGAGEPCDGEQLVTVSVKMESESYDSSCPKESLEPVLDPVTGLFSIKPKYLKLVKSNNPLIFRSKFNKMQNMVAISSSKNKKVKASKEKFLPTSDPVVERSKVKMAEMLPPVQDVTEEEALQMNEAEQLLEAKASIEVCENLELHFDAENE
ncbi:hypothetical protein V6N11_072357 [Hibiscus sabdariffa]|uniref:RRM domain-containing protein n=1 Tax=Hibiscus sabdariffa TaxID=183260 RepID=A0ABR2U2V6_9ROSI